MNRLKISSTVHRIYKLRQHIATMCVVKIKIGITLFMKHMFMLLEQHDSFLKNFQSPT